jgi:hypothetical protein
MNSMKWNGQGYIKTSYTVKFNKSGTSETKWLPGIIIFQILENLNVTSCLLHQIFCGTN